MPTATLGKKVSDFTAAATGGNPFRLKDALKAGQAVVVYFYPKDLTSGCTKESCAFGALHKQFSKAGAVVVGVSPDSLVSHEKFKAKYSFPFELLSDEDQALCQLFAVWKEKSMYGKTFMGVQRSTFLIDGAGVVRKTWPKVKPEGHAAEVLEAIKEIG